MKKLIMGFFFSLSVLAAFSQDSSHILKTDKYFQLFDFSKIKLPSYLKKYDENILDNHIAGKSSKVRILPLDNMPCFVPDVAIVTKIPNRKSIGVAIPIPNKIILSNQ